MNPINTSRAIASVRFLMVILFAVGSHFLISSSGIGAGGAYLFCCAVGTILLIVFGGRFRLFYVLGFTISLLHIPIIYGELSTSDWLLTIGGFVVFPCIITLAVSSATASNSRTRNPTRNAAEQGSDGKPDTVVS